jgi:hypothetical protein
MAVADEADLIDVLGHVVVVRPHRREPLPVRCVLPLPANPRTSHHVSNAASPAPRKIRAYTVYQRFEMQPTLGADSVWKCVHGGQIGTARYAWGSAPWRTGQWHKECAPVR